MGSETNNRWEVSRLEPQSRKKVLIELLEIDRGRESQTKTDKYDDSQILSIDINANGAYHMNTDCY